MAWFLIVKRIDYVSLSGYLQILHGWSMTYIQRCIAERFWILYRPAFVFMAYISGVKNSGSKKGVMILENINQFIAELKKYRHDISKQTLSTLRGQALSGDIDGASKGLTKVLNKKSSDSERFTNAHRSTRYMTKKYNDIDYKTQFEITLKSR